MEGVTYTSTPYDPLEDLILKLLCGKDERAISLAALTSTPIRKVYRTLKNLLAEGRVQKVGYGIYGSTAPTEKSTRVETPAFEVTPIEPPPFVSGDKSTRVETPESTTGVTDTVSKEDKEIRDIMSYSFRVADEENRWIPLRFCGHKIEYALKPEKNVVIRCGAFAKDDTAHYAYLSKTDVGELHRLFDFEREKAMPSAPSEQSSQGDAGRTGEEGKEDISTILRRIRETRLNRILEKANMPNANLEFVQAVLSLTDLNREQFENLKWQIRNTSQMLEDTVSKIKDRDAERLVNLLQKLAENFMKALGG